MLDGRTQRNRMQGKYRIMKVMIRVIIKRMVKHRGESIVQKNAFAPRSVQFMLHAYFRAHNRTFPVLYFLHSITPKSEQKSAGAVDATGRSPNWNDGYEERKQPSSTPSSQAGAPIPPYGYPGQYPPYYPPYGNPPPYYGQDAPNYPSDAPPNYYPPPGYYPPYGYPPYPGQEGRSPWKESGSDKKRPLPSPAPEVVHAAYPPSKRFQSVKPQQFTIPTQQQKPAYTKPTTKSVRRKKKMYSDFVGVTYNKTHAKYQACITHYRKQHYLGRYKLAVDAALAYDESARLLKGASWKVNFTTRAAYEAAKAKELERLAASGGRKVDVDKSLAAVASKVEEIAVKAQSEQCHGRGVHHIFHAPNPPLVQVAHHATMMSESAAPTADAEGMLLKQHAMSRVDDKTGKKLTPFPHVTQYNNGSPKVTPSPSGLTTSPQQKQQPQSSPAAKDSKTPLPESPNPTRHAMGIETGTPDSAIRPTVLCAKYQGSGKRTQLAEAAAPSTKSSESSPPAKKETDEVDVSRDKTEYAPTRQLRSSRSPSKSASKVQTTPTTRASQRAVKTAPRPVMQNGTLAAASALMTLFSDKDKEEEEK